MTIKDPGAHSQSFYLLFSPGPAISSSFLACAYELFLLQSSTGSVEMVLSP